MGSVVPINSNKRKMEKFAGTLAVVTGASAGIGRGLVLELLKSKDLKVLTGYLSLIRNPKKSNPLKYPVLSGL